MKYDQEEPRVSSKEHEQSVKTKFWIQREGVACGLRQAFWNWTPQVSHPWLLWLLCRPHLRHLLCLVIHSVRCPNLRQLRAATSSHKLSARPSTHGLPSLAHIAPSMDQSILPSDGPSTRPSTLPTDGPSSLPTLHRRP